MTASALLPTDLERFNTTENWYRTTGEWPNRQQNAATVLDDVTPDRSLYDWDTDELWADIQRYDALADVVLPSIFESVTGTRDGYQDLTPSDIDPETVVERLETLRQAREAERDDDRPVKIVLLLDEVSLFIGTEFERLTELQTLAENVEERGDGQIQMVATAQAKIEDVRPEFAARGADFSIVKDRFPHRYQLPSKHVGEIAKQRLTRKSDSGAAAVDDILNEVDINPGESLVYNDIKQNTKPALDNIDEAELRDCYPFLPYHAPLFHEILFNLRREASDPAKSIFSGTARAILALMHRLLHDWIDEGESNQVISLVDFYDKIKPELRDTLPQDMRVIEGGNGTTATGIIDEIETGSLEPFDLRVAKAVLLLRQVHEIVPLDDRNLAVAVMSDLNGPPWVSMTNRVEESLGRLEKFIRPARDEGGPAYRFATQSERAIYEAEEDHESDPDWNAILDTLDTHLWDDLCQDIDLPDSVPYSESGDEYTVEYHFNIDGVDFETIDIADETDEGLNVHIEIEGIRPDSADDTSDEDTLYWSIDTEGIQDLRKQLIDWWALRAAVADHEAPQAVEHDLEERARSVRSKISSAMQAGSYRVKDRTDIGSLTEAVRETVDVTYPNDFHPMMLQVDEERLDELRQLDSDDPLPGWAKVIQVPSVDQAAGGSGGTIQNNVMALTGRQLKDRDDGLSIGSVLDGITEEKPFYEESRPALRAILWGFCRNGRLVPVDEAGATLANEVVLNLEARSTVRLQLLSSTSLGDILEEAGFKDTIDTVADGLINVREENEQVQASINGLREDVELVAETDIRTGAVRGLLEDFASELESRSGNADNRLATIRSQSDDIEEAIKQTTAAQDWVEEVSRVWNRRQPTLYKLDALLTVGDDRFAWVDGEASGAVQQQAAFVDDFERPWWTTDGWSELSEVVVPVSGDELARSWEQFSTDNELNTLVDRISAQSWIRPATEIPTSVQRGLEREFITPLRRLQQWYDTIDEALDILDGESDTAAVIEAAAAVAALEPLADHIDHDIDTLTERLNRAASLLEDRSLEEIDHLGVIPDDRNSIDERVARLVEARDIDVEETEEGVIIQ
jgi:hypothetical protein